MLRLFHQYISLRIIALFLAESVLGGTCDPERFAAYREVGNDRRGPEVAKGHDRIAGLGKRVIITRDQGKPCTAASELDGESATDAARCSGEQDVGHGRAGCSTLVPRARVESCGVAKVPVRACRWSKMVGRGRPLRRNRERA